jgi:hypothetical protein
MATESWAKDDEPIESNSVKNLSLRDETQIDITIPVPVNAIKCETELSWWQNKDPDKLRKDFANKLRGLDDTLWLPWSGLLVIQDTTFPITHKVTIPPCHSAWLASTTVQRYAYAFPMFQVEQYNTYHNKKVVQSNTWEHIGGEVWKNVFIRRYPVTCHASTAQGPVVEFLFQAQPMQTALPRSRCK